MKLKGWKNIPAGGNILDAGNSKNYNTGTWRSLRPVRAKDKCTNCLICFMFCPDLSVIVKKEKFDRFDYNHCKGCGVCAKECPFGAISMVPEGDTCE